MKVSRLMRDRILTIETRPRSTLSAAEERKLEAFLFEQERAVYFLSFGNVLHGVDADIDAGVERDANHDELLRRLAEVANLMLDAGVILIVTAVELARHDLQILETTIGRER